MAISALLSVSPFTVASSSSKTFLLTSTSTRVFSSSISPRLKQNRFIESQSFSILYPLPRYSTRFCSTQDGFLRKTEEEEEEIVQLIPSIGVNPLKFAICVVFWASCSLLWFARSGDAKAAADSIKSSSVGLRIAATLRRFGWPDEAVVFALATLPVIELRGAIPVGYWMQLKPTVLTFFSVLGNMVPVPFIILYLKKFASFVAGKSQTASKLLEILFKRAKEKAGPVEEFQWLGLMLFVAVPFPGTGAWTGAIIASILDMPYWSAVTSNFCGVVLAGLLVNLLVNLGLKEAIVAGIALFFVSTVMWSVLRNIKKSIRPSLP
uniref:Small multi-drug export protein n=1 Tax=Noccaea caerulescens TaxID=107243 RepID=A0A1J3D9D9_NOCCA